MWKIAALVKFNLNMWIYENFNLNVYNIKGMVYKKKIKNCIKKKQGVIKTIDKEAN